MKIDILTLFPEMLKPMLSESILGRAIAAGLLQVRLTDIREFTADRHRRVDDYPFGGGAGMVMAAQPIADAIAARDPEHRARRIYLSPRGRKLDQRIVEELAREPQLLLLCGHYEGVDQRALDLCIDEELSIGDYVLTGGELGALVVVDAVARLVPGVLGSAESGEDESFTTGLLEYPQYTRPAEFRGLRVPEVLLGGNHADIAAWRRERSLELTCERRPDLLQTAPLTESDRDLLDRMARAGRAIEALADRSVAARRMDMAEADAFPKRWFAAFVPEESRKAAKRHCFSGRRHVGWLWQAYSMDFAPHVSGGAARAQLELHAGEVRQIYLCADRVLLETPNGLTPGAADALGPCLMVGAAQAFTYAQTGRPGAGPFFQEREN